VAGSHDSIGEVLAEKWRERELPLRKGHSPLLEAAANGRLDIVRKLAAPVRLHGATDAGKNALNLPKNAVTKK